MPDTPEHDRPTMPGPAEPNLPDPERIGPYKILSNLGEGGMGMVYLAEQKEPVRRRVALKVIKLGMDSKSVLHRFEGERQALAMMEHGNIARVLEAGTTETGQPFFAMEYVRGIPLNEYCDNNKLGLQERIELFRQVCSGVQHAHHKGIIHRDLKPGNILVTVQDGKARVKIIDFGLARATDHRLLETTMFTQQGQIIGTPEYMSPEQAGLNSLDIDTRSDVYSLGVILYELLVGDLPFPAEELRKAGLLEIQRRIREDDPPKPSTRLTTLEAEGDQIASRRRTDFSGLKKKLRGDLDWIIMKALEKDRTRRFGSPEALADDLKRFLQDEPVLASPPSASYRLGKLLKRYRGQVIAAAAVFLSLVIGLIAFAIENQRARRNAELERIARDEADEQRSIAQQKIAEYDMLASLVQLRRTQAAERELYPAWPEKASAMEAWLRDVDAQMQGLPELRATVANLAARNEPSEAQRFLQETLTGLILDLEALEENELQEVRERHSWAERVETISVVEHADAWIEAINAIAEDENYGFELETQLGLVPLGQDPESGLQEFYHLRSAKPGLPIPDRSSEEGGLRMDGDRGIIFVLLPGGSFHMGAQLSNDGPNQDPQATPEETAHEVELEPFFLSKFELTQGQWFRMSRGEDPSRYKHGQSWANKELDWGNPVEQVSWEECVELLSRHRLMLPSESEWEYACRAGTSTPWYTGRRAQSLQGHANLLDQFARRAGSPYSGFASIEDGHQAHAPVGSYRANAFGLYDMHGNVFEWCLDWYDHYTKPMRDASGKLPENPTDIGRRTHRGGSFLSQTQFARSASRGASAAQVRASDVGLRPARRIY
ncbi:MAG: protein kinase domain-containing protein [Planctomycetota bacterium]|jgi:serine/threonine protein kinase/formylglycine-generating enzyme required for sulfatase activity